MRSASTMLSTCLCFPLPFVENESSATAGSASISVRVLSAVAMAISANWLEVGSMTMAQSANASSPLCPHSRFWTAMMNTLDTRRTPGLAPTACKAARTVSAVVLAAPPTLPSASPAATIRAAK